MLRLLTRAVTHHNFPFLITRIQAQEKATLLALQLVSPAPQHSVTTVHNNVPT